MKQGNLTISFDEEKLAALRRYMGKKELDLEAAYREKWCLTKGQIAELKEELSASLS